MPTSLNTGTPPIKPQDDMQTSPNKLKMLCLHGYLQNADVFRSRMGSTRKALKSRCEYVFVDFASTTFNKKINIYVNEI
jgi:hypothetical protein